MKKYFLFLALTMVALTAISCKNSKSNGATKEVVETAKTILAEDVLTTLDKIAEPYIDEAGKVEVNKIIAASLTEKEKLVKPDYLLDPRDVYRMVTRSQRVNALAVLIAERGIREAYEMPLDEADETIARLIVELNHPVSFENERSMSISEKVVKNYNLCKEQGNLASFWQFEYAVQIELCYLISRNPELFFRNVTEEQSVALSARFRSCIEALRELAGYDDEIAEVLAIYESNNPFSSEGEAYAAYSTLEGTKQQFIDSKELFAVRRAKLLE